jgi:membrane protein DedA with SNARE-associated domain
MDTLERALAWLSTLPQGGLVAAMALLAAIENIFPPIPADVLVAFGAFLSARGGRSAWPAFLAVWLGNMVGVAIMYGLGRRYGTSRVERRYHLDRSGRADERILAYHRRYGILAFFLSRFIPGVRAVVPPVAGALRIPFAGAMVAMAAASGLWYGAITILAFRAGNNWETLRAGLGKMGSWTAGIAVLLGAIIAILIWRRRRGRDQSRTA